MTERTTDDPDRAAAPDQAAAARDTSVAAPDIGGLAGVLSAREAAAALGVSERTVRRAIQRGELVATKHAGMFQVTPAAIDDYRRGETGQRTRTAAAAADNTAAAPATAPAAAADSGPAENDAVAVLRQLLAEERATSDRLLEAATVWQARAVQLEARLLALESGPLPSEAAAAEAPAAALEAPESSPSPRSGDGLLARLRRLWGG